MNIGLSVAFILSLSLQTCASVIVCGDRPDIHIQQISTPTQKTDVKRPNVSLQALKDCG